MSEFKPTEFDSSINVTPTHPLKETAWLIGTIVALIITLYFLLGFALSLIIPHISPQAETKIWEALRLSETENIKTPPERIKQQEFFQALFDSLPESVKPRGYNFKIHVVNDKDLNALALPGGHIVLTSGLIDAIDNENELVFVLGHELGHFHNRDHLKALGRFAGTAIMSAVLMGQGGGDAVNFIGKLVSLTDLANSRHDEKLADIWGVKTVIDHYGHAGGATNLFTLLKQNRHIRIPAILSTHPLDEDRIEALNNMIERNDYDVLPVKARSWPDPLPESGDKNNPPETPVEQLENELEKVKQTVIKKETTGNNQHERNNP